MSRSQWRSALIVALRLVITLLFVPARAPRRLQFDGLWTPRPNRSIGVTQLVRMAALANDKRRSDFRPQADRAGLLKDNWRATAYCGAGLRLTGGTMPTAR